MQRNEVVLQCGDIKNVYGLSGVVVLWVLLWTQNVDLFKDVLSLWVARHSQCLSSFLLLLLHFLLFYCFISASAVIIERVWVREQEEERGGDVGEMREHTVIFDHAVLLLVFSSDIMQNVCVFAHCLFRMWPGDCLPSFHTDWYSMSTAVFTDLSVDNGSTLISMLSLTHWPIWYLHQACVCISENTTTDTH